MKLFISRTAKSSLIILTLSLLASLLILPGQAVAHGIKVEATESSDEVVHVTSLYSGSRPCKGCIVIVKNKGDGAELLRGRTNDNGEFQFDHIYDEDIIIEIRTSTGHRATLTLDDPDSHENGYDNN